jgi:hypothetical protein
LLLAALLHPASAPGWGADGHRIVCEIAWLELEESARAAVQALLPARGPHARFADACSWADEIRDERRFPQYRHDDERHYLNVEAGATGVDLARDCPGRCVVEGIAHHAAVLGSGSAKPRARREALMFLAHLVGDVHQPLHVGYREDLGGNRIAVRYRDHEPQCRMNERGRRCEHNLHRVWDELLVSMTLGARTPPLGWEAYAHALARAIDDAERRLWSSTGAADWAGESFAIVRERIYPVADGAVIDEAYRDAYRGLLETRLEQAGVRLAATLERLLTPDR